MNWQYISGFFDADGSITFVRNHKNEERSPQISFSNNYKEILIEMRDFIEEELNIKGTITKKKAQKDTHSDNYDLSYNYFPKALLLKKKLKLKHPKKIWRFNLLLQLNACTPRNGKYTQEIKNERDRLTKEFFSQ